MKTIRLKLASALAALFAALPLFADPTNAGDLARDFPQVVKYELGSSDFAPGDSIKIEEIHGTTADIAPGGTYCVTGTYTLSSQDEADLDFYATTTNRITTATDPQQTMHITKGAGSFHLIKKMTGQGYLHLTFYSRVTGNGFGGVYFGQGQWVFRNKHFSYGHEASKADIREPLSFTGPNRVLFEYLGNPVPPPPNLDTAYTKDGLTRAMAAAARDAGVSLVKLEIDDSEFPFLVGLVFAHTGEKAKFLGQIRKVAAYSHNGGVGDGGDGTSYATDLTPYTAYPTEYSAYPREGVQRIYRRTMLRESVLFDKITGKQ